MAPASSKRCMLSFPDGRHSVPLVLVEQSTFLKTAYDEGSSDDFKTPNADLPRALLQAWVQLVHHASIGRHRTHTIPVQLLPEDLIVFIQVLLHLVCRLLVGGHHDQVCIALACSACHYCFCTYHHTVFPGVMFWLRM